MGLVAHSAATDASLRICCGVVADGDEQRRGDLDADAEGAQKRRVGLFAQAAQLAVGGRLSLLSAPGGGELGFAALFWLPMPPVRCWCLVAAGHKR